MPTQTGRTTRSNRPKSQKPPKPLTFGVEIEGLLPDGKSRSYLAKKLNGEPTPHDRSNTNIWNVGTDSSITSVEGFDGFEARSPVILYSPEGLQKIRSAVELISAQGGKVDNSCGGHVHVGGWRTDDFWKDAITGMHIAESVQHLEHAIWQYSGGEKRASGEYCKPVGNTVTSYAQNKTTALGSSMNQIFSDKYRAVNFYTMTGETVEFRLFAGTLSPEVITVNIQIACEIVRAAMNGKSIIVSVENFKDLSKVFPMIDTTKLKKWVDAKRAIERPYARPTYKYHESALKFWRLAASQFSDERRLEYRRYLSQVVDGMWMENPINGYDNTVIGTTYTFSFKIRLEDGTFRLAKAVLDMREYRPTDSEKSVMRLYDYQFRLNY